MDLPLCYPNPPWEHPLWGWAELALVVPKGCTCVFNERSEKPVVAPQRRIIASQCPHHGIEAELAKV